MKKILFAILLIAANVFAQNPSVNYSLQTAGDSIQWGTTNSFLIDTRLTTAMGLGISMVGTNSHGTTSLLGVTNIANSTNGQTFKVIVGAVTNTYTLTNTPWNSNVVYSAYATNLFIGFTNGTVNGDSVTLVRNGNTNIFTFTNSPSAPTDVLTNTTANGSATNFFLVAGAYHRLLSLNGNLITWQTFPDGSTVSETDDSIATNQVIGVATVTNYTYVNNRQIMVTNTINQTATNIWTSLTADYSPLFVVTMPTASQVQLVPVFNPGLAIPVISGAWATNLNTTNAMVGNLYFKGSNSLDQLTWFRDSTKDFSLGISATATNYYTNWTSIGPSGFWSWGIENAQTNYGAVLLFNLKTSVKQGL